MGQVYFITQRARPTEGFHRVSLSIDETRTEAWVAHEGVANRYAAIQIRDKWLNDCPGEVIFQADYEAGLAHFHFENPDTAFAFKMRFG